MFEMVFENVMDVIVDGEGAKQFIDRDPRNINYGRFVRWVHKNPERLERFKEAYKLGTYANLEKMRAIAEGSDTPEDVQRSSLRWKHFEFEAKALNREQFGDTKQVDVNVSNVISIRALLEERQNQLEALEGEYAVIG